LTNKPGKNKKDKKTSESGKEGSGKNKGKNKKNKKQNNQKDGDTNKYEIPAWMKKPPKAADMKKPNKVDNVEYHWCPKHARWTQHKASECRLPDPTNNSSSSASTSSSNNNTNSASDPSLRLTGAMTRVVRYADEDSDE
jgi:hypothetical protein